jgi:hypothetical protein
MGSAMAVLLVTASNTASRAFGGRAPATAATTASGPLSGSGSTHVTCAAPDSSQARASIFFTEP